MVEAKNIYPMEIAGRTIEAEMKSVPLDSIKLDPDNVRFKHIPRRLTDKELEDLIWNRPETRVWYREIIYAKGLSERPYLQQVEGHYVVREGNMRIVCLRRLREAIRKKKIQIPIERIDPLSCVVFPKEVTEEEVSIFLTRVHVKSKADWAKFNKAAQVLELAEVHGMDHADITKACGIGKAEVGRMIIAYKAMREYFDKYTDAPPEKNLDIYSYFDEFYKLKPKLKAEKIDPAWIDNNLNHFMEWVHNNQLETGKQVRALPAMIKRPKIYQMLLNGKKMKDVIKELTRVDPTLGDDLFRKIDKTAKLYDFTHEKLVEIANNPSELEYLKNLHQKLGKVIETVEIMKKRG